MDFIRVVMQGYKLTYQMLLLTILYSLHEFDAHEDDYPPMMATGVPTTVIPIMPGSSVGDWSTLMLASPFFQVHNILFL